MEDTCNCTHTQACEVCAASKDINIDWAAINAECKKQWVMCKDRMPTQTGCYKVKFKSKRVKNEVLPFIRTPERKLMFILHGGNEVIAWEEIIK